MREVLTEGMSEVWADVRGVSQLPDTGDEKRRTL